MQDYDATGKSVISLKPPNISPVKEVTTHGTDTAFSGYQHELNSLIHDWCSSSDTLYCIHPVDGSLLIWVVDYIDDFTSAYYRQVQVSFASRIPATFSKADATSLCWTDTFHYTEAQLNPSHSPVGGDTTDTTPEEHIHDMVHKTKNLKKTDKLAVLQSSYMVSAHADGSLNLWLVTFSDSGSFTGVASITHITRSCGPRFGTTQLVAHPSLPLVVGTSQRNNSSFQKKKISNNSTSNDIESELILWNTNHVSPLSEFKGVTEMARISSPDPNKFLYISWVPELFHFSLLSITNDGIDLLPSAPSACFIAATDKGLCLYQILLDSKTLLSNLGMLKFSASLPHHMQILSDLIESEQSGSQSACIMNVCYLDQSDTINNIKFLHVFNKQAVSRKKQDSSTTTTTTINEEEPAFNRSYSTVHDNEQEFYVFAVYDDESHYDSTSNRQKFAVWRLTISSDEKFASTLSPVSVEDGDLFSPSSPPTGGAIPTPLAINHCINQQLIYHENVSSSASQTWRLFSATAGLHSSDEFCSSLPVKYHFSAISSSDSSLDFWELILDENNKFSVQKCHRVSNKLSNGETVVSLACASSSRLAFITHKEALGNRVDYSLVVKENETSGEEQWNTEYSRLFYPDVDISPGKESIIKISWLSLENGQFLLAVAVNNEVLIFCRTRTPVLGSSKGTKHVFDWNILKKVCLCVVNFLNY